jgi:hypothetical protein
MEEAWVREVFGNQNGDSNGEGNEIRDEVNENKE